MNQGTDQTHPINNLHTVLRIHWKNAMWAFIWFFCAGLGWAASSLLCKAVEIHWVR